MRLQPPKDWPHEYMNEDLFDEYVKKYTIITESELGKIERINLLDFYKFMLINAKDRFEVAMKMSALFPHSYQMDFLKSLLRIT